MANKGKWIIPLDKIPHDVVVHHYIYKNTDIQNQISKFKNFSIPDYLEMPLNFDHSKLEKSVKEAIGLYGLHEFSYKDAKKESKSYVSSSLTYNPDAIDKISEDPHKATLGSTQLMHGSASQYDNVSTARNTYNDTLAFKDKTPFAQYGDVKTVVDSFKRTLVSSRISTVLAGHIESTKMEYCWHNDELVFINLRVNIPIQTSPNYVIQIISNSEGETLNTIEFPLKIGKAYVYDTNKYHRPYCKKLDTLDRINMICGVSPWFDFDPHIQAWVSNEFYGEVHPFEMFKMGEISGLIKS